MINFGRNSLENIITKNPVIDKFKENKMIFNEEEIKEISFHKPKNNNMWKFYANLSNSNINLTGNVAIINEQEAFIQYQVNFGTNVLGNYIESNYQISDKENLQIVYDSQYNNKVFIARLVSENEKIDITNSLYIKLLDNKKISISTLIKLLKFDLLKEKTKLDVKSYINKIENDLYHANIADLSMLNFNNIAGFGNDDIQVFVLNTKNNVSIKILYVDNTILTTIDSNDKTNVFHILRKKIDEELYICKVSYLEENCLIDKLEYKITGNGKRIELHK